VPAAQARQDPALREALPSDAVQVGVRPEHWQLMAPDQGLAMSVTTSEYLGAQRLVYGQLDDGTIVQVLVDGSTPTAAGDRLHITPQPQRWHAFDANERRLSGGER
jgi:ABC-type sugar transport system ATPase subunit